MEDLVETLNRIESLKTLAAKKIKKQQRKMPKRENEERLDYSLGVSLMDAMGAFDYGSKFSDDRAFFDVDSALAARKTTTLEDLEDLDI
jgi:hypothetical protein